MAATAPEHRKIADQCLPHINRVLEDSYIADSLASGPWTLFVESERTGFPIDQDHLRQVSTFFRAAFAFQCKESPEKTMDILQEELDIVEQGSSWTDANSGASLWTAKANDRLRGS